MGLIVINLIIQKNYCENLKIVDSDYHHIMIRLNTDYLIRSIKYTI